MSICPPWAKAPGWTKPGRSCGSHWLLTSHYRPVACTSWYQMLALMRLCTLGTHREAALKVEDALSAKLPSRTLSVCSRVQEESYYFITQLNKCLATSARAERSSGRCILFKGDKVLQSVEIACRGHLIGHIQVLNTFIQYRDHSSRKRSFAGGC